MHFWQLYISSSFCFGKILKYAKPFEKMQKIQISENVYKEIEKGILRLEKCKVNEDIFSIPGEIFYKTTKYKISEIGDNVFFGCKQLKFIKIPSSVESIGNHCF